MFGQPSAKSSADDDKLMDLYWNRNELKKEFASLRQEKFELDDRLKVQKGDYARLEQKLRHLEDLLANPEWSRSMMVHYRLRGLESLCAAKVAHFAEQIKQQREQKKHGKALAEWRASIAEDVESVEAEIANIAESVKKTEDQMRALHQRFTAMNGFIRFFRRRALNRQVSQANEYIQNLGEQSKHHEAHIEEIQRREPPENVGLTLVEKRSINQMILAYAQELYLQFRDDQLVVLVKEAAEKSAGAVRYGNDADCEEILERLAQCELRLQSGGNYTESLKKRAKLMSEEAQYQHGDDAVPLPATVSTLYRFDQGGNARTSDLDLLGENYWNVSGTLSR